MALPLLRTYREELVRYGSGIQSWNVFVQNAGMNIKIVMLSQDMKLDLLKVFNKAQDKEVECFKLLLVLYGCEKQTSNQNLKIN